MDRETPAKILPCPKFRLRAVNIMDKNKYAQTAKVIKELSRSKKYM